MHYSEHRNTQVPVGKTVKSKVFKKYLIGELSKKRMIRSLLLIYTFFLSVCLF